MVQKKLRMAFLLLLFIFASGIAGYRLIEGWGFLDALYMTVITIASVGYMEVHPLSPEGRIFTILLIITGMGILLFGISTFTAFLVEGELSEILRKRKMEKEISKIKGHYIVCGIGRTGKHILEELHKTGRPFVVIDKNEEVCKELDERGLLYVRGDATSTAKLKAANADQAKGVFCALPHDAENLLLILTAKGINPDLKIISKAEEDESASKMRKAGADGVVLPEFIGGLRMTSEMVRPETVTFLDKMLKSQDAVYRVEEVLISKDSPWSGKHLQESGIFEMEGITVVAVRKGERYLFNPKKELALEKDDVIIIIGETSTVRKIKGW